MLVVPRKKHATLFLTPAAPCQTLGELLEKVTDENVHGEADTGRAVGDEAW